MILEKKKIFTNNNNELLFDIFFYVYLENISVAGHSLDDAQSLELSSHQCQHAAVDVIQADAWRTQGQAGTLHLQHGLVQFSLRWAESAKGGCGKRHTFSQMREK